MSDIPSSDNETEQKSSEPGLTDEFSTMGKNLIGILRAAWEHPERQRLQQEIEDGLVGLGVTLRKEAQTVAEHPASQRIKDEVNDLGNRVRSGEVEAKVRTELTGALRIMNTELEKVAQMLSTTKSADRDSSPSAETGSEPASTDASAEQTPTQAEATEPPAEES